MFVVTNYGIAVLLCFVTMICWGSWANTQKLAGKTWRFELFYWDYCIGILAAAILFALTLGSIGSEGRSFFADLAQADPNNLFWAAIGGVVFNAANILLVASIAIAGMSVAFPVGIGLALVIGVIVNYWAQPEGNPTILFLGVGLITASIILSAISYRTIPNQKSSNTVKGLALAIVCGILMGYFYRFVASSMVGDFLKPEAGKLTPYTAMVFFSLGLFISNFLLNTIIMKWPFVGEPVALTAYFKGSFNDHIWGIVGGLIWALGMTLNIIAIDQAGPAISYGLGQGATMIAAFWGVFVWREFREAPSKTNILLALMFLGYLVGLGLIIYARM